jgi:putative endonuclease
LQVRDAVTRERAALGKRGEDLACAELRRRGYAILARRCRLPGGELDIVARDGPTLVFVEVKTREAGGFGDAAEAVTPAKQRRVARLAAEYLARHGWSECPCRFDVVSVRFERDRPVLTVYRHAFDATG